MTLPPPFAALAAYNRFVTYTLAPDPDRPGKTIKRPTDVRTGLWCKVNDPAHHYSYAEAAATGRPVGFVIHEADGFFFLDIDGALLDGAWNPQAQQLCGELAGAAAEVSQSGTGLHVVGRGNVPPHSCRNILAGLELYTHDRFIALTGTGAVGDVMSDQTAAISAIAARYFPHNPHSDIAGWSDTPVDDWDGPRDDADLLRAAMASGKKTAAAAFGQGHVTFEDLWTGNADALARKWPTTTVGEPYDRSYADAALASHLAYWTGKNCERIRSLMWQSELARGKWEDRPDWLDTTILNASAVVKNVAQGKPVPPPPSAEIVAASGIELRPAGCEFITIAEQLVKFSGCVYVVGDNKVWIPRSGDMLDKARFDVVYSGHVFPIDAQNEKTTESAWDAFTRNRVYSAPQVDVPCFRPECPAGAIISEEGRSLVNTYLPIETRRIAGDPTPFLRHLEKILPVERDRVIILHYMASLKQNPGYKFQWWPVIQGAEGNGKSMLARIMAHAMGARYSHLVNPEAMAKTGNQFNSWVQGNLFLAIEEIYVGPNRREFLDSFKTTVTDDRIAMEGKGDNQGVGDNRLNGMLFSNHLDAVPVNIDSRRYGIFFTAQQNADDIERSGMGGSYFPDLYDWFAGRRAHSHGGPGYGYAIVNEFLSTLALQAELDPANLSTRAPRTSSTDKALKLSLGRAEQELIEAIEEGRPGFAGGWVSSLAVDRLLDGMRASVPRTKRRALLQSIGYDYHPGLEDGRVSNIVAPDNGKPRLYVRHGHLSCGLTDRGSIAKAYTTAQNSTVNDAAAVRFGG